ncbi:hypothetical protein DFH08DRAFT_822071 [Mycena albidolilacea]|uniref:Uncharacterized protein n=1 Tax=Mycena albidolilacea TaxID=1033008 RepID=A0AAD6Z9T1_9AGAR|nr:hypothetical protein DFH08DRAFT_822071 [Mycena albidolilacea]
MRVPPISMNTVIPTPPLNQAAFPLCLSTRSAEGQEAGGSVTTSIHLYISAVARFLTLNFKFRAKFLSRPTFKAPIAWGQRLKILLDEYCGGLKDLLEENTPTNITVTSKSENLTGFQFRPIHSVGFSPEPGPNTPARYLEDSLCQQEPDLAPFTEVNVKPPPHRRFWKPSERSFAYIPKVGLRSRELAGSHVSLKGNEAVQSVDLKFGIWNHDPSNHLNPLSPKTELPTTQAEILAKF